MSTFYQVAYAVGFTPWERSAAADAGRLDELLRREEAERGGPGRALDVGCGTGVHALTLARRGWDVTAVDVVERALGRARTRLARERVAATVVRADATTLPADVVGDDFDLVLDVGCFHGLRTPEQRAMGRAVTDRTRPGATLLMLVLGRSVGPPFMPTGASRADIEDAFPGWKVTDVHRVPTDAPGMPRLARRGEPTFYRLRRTPVGGPR
ncbi:class I SAM-dependent methyltransferase [Isoptericola sp. NPDC057191]|uniref:class I SAM-dependent methyltransferase n=1 Tax=Isoptericola sp. NPDC057191 TaxID=3346041 RepID=UPI0036418B4E